MKKKTLVLEYLATTDLHPTGCYKIIPETCLNAFYNWLKENKYVKDDKKESK